MSAWPSPFSVGDALPEVGECVLLDNGDRYCVGYRHTDGNYYTEQDGLQFYPQYWYPLPSRSAETV